MTNRCLLLAWLLPAKRNQQETCQKSRRDSDLVHQLVSIHFFVKLIVEGFAKELPTQKNKSRLNLPPRV
jgi:hypothetical protein